VFLAFGVRAQAAGQGADSTGPATFIVLVRGARVGTETIALNRVGADWFLSGSGRLGPPFDVVTSKFEMTYGSDWQPTKLDLNGSIRGQGVALTTTFGLTTALNDMAQGLQRGSASHQLQPRSIVLPSMFFASYEALAARVATAAPGTRLPVYVAPDGQTSVTVSPPASRRVSIGDRILDFRAYSLSLSGMSASSNIELWIDSRNRLARLEMPTVSLVVIRDDLASVMAREVRARNARDDDEFVPSNGFSLGATITAPAPGKSAPAPAGRKPAGAPAVVLVASAGPQDRDLTTYGVPIFGQLAGALSDAGYLVLRYDSRGVGRSGGRTESATLAEYADDVVRVVDWLRRRADVDPNRIALVGYGDGGPVALSAATRIERVRAVALVATPGKGGRDVTLDQQAQILSRLSISDAERTTRIDMQHRIIAAATTGKGWETIPQDVRAQADTPWFKSWLQFEPGAALKKMKQPLLLVRGTLDTEVPEAHTDNLEMLSRTGRNKLPESHTKKVVLPGLNHLMVAASTGSVDEYSTLNELSISPTVATTIADWLSTSLAAVK
jgi:pimeloyl-ACP methyl ester carboxylesterase